MTICRWGHKLINYMKGEICFTYFHLNQNDFIWQLNNHVFGQKKNDTKNTSLESVMISGKKLTLSFNTFPLTPPLALVLSMVKIRPETPRFRCCTYNKKERVSQSLINKIENTMATAWLVWKVQGEPYMTILWKRKQNYIVLTFLDQSSNNSWVLSFCLKLSPSAFSLCPSTWFSQPLPRTSSTRRM